MDEDDRIREHLLASLAANGVAAFKVSDGEVFAFTRARLEEFTRQMDASGRDEVIVFVKTGGKPIKSN